MAEGLARSLREELDLGLEARNMTSVAAASARRGDSGMRIPAPVESMSTRRVLVMERLDGQALSTIKPEALPHNRDVLARNILESLLREVIIDGVFHAGPHPGNIFLLTDGQVGLLDFGSVGRIDSRMRIALQRLFLSVDRGDPAMLTDAQLIVYTEDTDPNNLMGDHGCPLMTVVCRPIGLAAGTSRSLEASANTVS